MTSRPERTAVLVSSANALQPGGGGVQRCTREYVALAAAAGWTVHPVAYDYDRRPAVRLARLLRPHPYRNLIPPETAARAAAEVRRTGAGWVFLNQVEAGLLARPLAAALAGSAVRVALLSHGADSTDGIHDARMRAGGAAADALADADLLRVGRQLGAELEMHSASDVVFCLSEVDLEIARWLGGRRVVALPRVVVPEPLDWRPVAGRLGTVSTLDHGPNVEGIERTAAALDAAGRADVRLRLVGRPSAAGEALARRFRCLDYLGPLDDAAFAAEAATWCAFLNPIHCFARGSSTKLAVPLAWELPLVTTRAGARGYRWDEALVPIHEDAAAFAAAALRAADPAEAARLRDGVRRLAAGSPRLTDLVSLFNGALDGAPRPA
jgi:hypothetical protein